MVQTASKRLIWPTKLDSWILQLAKFEGELARTFWKKTWLPSSWTCGVLPKKKHFSSQPAINDTSHSNASIEIFGDLFTPFWWVFMVQRSHQTAAPRSPTNASRRTECCTMACEPRMVSPKTGVQRSLRFHHKGHLFGFHPHIISYSLERSLGTNASWKSYGYARKVVGNGNETSCFHAKPSTRDCKITILSMPRPLSR